MPDGKSKLFIIPPFANAYYYLVEGTPTADKFYVYYDDGACWGVTGWWCWSYNGLTPEHVDNDGQEFGTGKRKTEKMLKRNNGAYVASPAGGCNGTMWWWINYMRTNDGGMGGCTDWFIPSEEEVRTLYYSGSRPSWIMSRVALCTCRDWNADGYTMCKCSDGGLEGTGKYDGNRVVAIRSF